MYKPLLIIHRWSGIVAAVLLIVAGVSGTVVTYRAELDRALNPELLRVAPSGSALDADQLAAAVEKQFPDTTIQNVNIGTGAEDAWTFMLAPRKAARGEGGGASLLVHVDPYRGAVTGVRTRGEAGLDRSRIVGTFYELHHDLFLGATGHWILAIAGIVWLILSLIGIALGLIQGGGLKRAFRVEWRKGIRRLLLDLHRSAGLVSVSAILVIAFSGVYLSIRPEVTSLVSVFSPVSPPPERTWPARNDLTDIVGLHRAIEAAQQFSGGRAQSVQVNRGKGFYRVRLAKPNDLYLRGDTNVFVDMGDAHIIDSRVMGQGTGGDKFLGWQRALHSGEALGAIGRIVVFVAGLLPLLFGVSGIYLWLQRKRLRRAGSARAESVTERVRRSARAKA